MTSTPQASQDTRLATQFFGIQVAVAENSPLAPDQNETVLATALALHQAGFNVFPVKSRSKQGYPGWKLLQFVRLMVDQLAKLINAIPDRANLAIITGRTSGNLAILDCESSDKFMEVSRILATAGIPLFGVTSGGKKGGGHFYIRCSHELKNIPQLAENLELRGNRNYVLAPTAVHPDTGIIYDWWGGNNTQEPPVVPLATLQSLFPGIAPVIPESTAKPFVPYSPLSRTTQDYLDSGHALSEGSRNKRLFAAACDMQGNDYSYEETYSQLEPIARASGLGSRAIQATLKSAYSSSRTSSKPKRDSRPFIPHWQKALQWAQAHHWQGRTGAVDRAVMLAMIERAKYAGKDNWFRASQREIADKARVTRKTAGNSINRLITSGYLEPSKLLEEINGAKRYRLSTKIQVSLVTPLTHTGQVNSGVNSDSDLVEKGGLGKTTYLVWKRLKSCENPIRRGELSAMCKLTPSNTSKSLAKLEDLGLAISINGFWQGIEVDEITLAIELGVDGKGEDRAAFHEHERATRAFVTLLGSIHRQYARYQLGGNGDE